MTWDPKEKAYKAYIFGNDFPGAVVETGNFEGDTLVFRGEMTMGDTKITMRNSSRIGEKGRDDQRGILRNGQRARIFASASGGHAEAVTQIRTIGV